MSMQLFSFGHPCEHQLRRTCIGGVSCPLNGYPDIWCCSYIKGKINFKRDKPCEGPRCRWGFTHPTQQQFDAVTQVLSESRPIAAKIDEADDREMLSFHMDNPHIVDTVQCALHMMRHTPSSCARRVGQLLACAAVKSGDAKVFMQLLKTMKKPVDSYVLGAYAFLTQGNPPHPGPATQPHGKETAKGKKDKGGGGGNNASKKEDVVEELKNDMVDLMNAALSQGGHLVDRDDQHVLQATFIQALKQYPRSNKRRQEQLDAALGKFGNRQIPKEQPKTTTAAAATTSATPGGASEEPAAGTTTPTSTTATTAAAAAAAKGPTPQEAAQQAPHPQSSAAPPSAATVTPPSAAAATPKHAAPATGPSAPTELPPPSSVAAPPTPQTQHAQSAQPPPPPPPPVVGISRLAALRPAVVDSERRYEPIRTDLPLPDIFILGGLFNLSPHPVNRAPLGLASPAMAAAAAAAAAAAQQRPLPSGGADLPAFGGGGSGQGGAPAFLRGNQYPLPPLSQHPMEKSGAGMSATAVPSMGALPQTMPPPTTQQPEEDHDSVTFIESIFGNVSAMPVFDDLDTNQIFKDFDDGWVS